MSVQSEQALEKQIQDLGLNVAPRVTPAMADAAIKDQSLIKIDGIGMLCNIELHNGFKLLGKNLGPVSAPNYSEQMAKQLAYEDARKQIFPFLGFMLAEDIYRGNRPLTQEQLEMPAHVQRVITEMYQVAARLLGLTEFLAKFDAGTLSDLNMTDDEIADLREQHGYMKSYVAVLQRRLDRAGV